MKSSLLPLLLTLASLAPEAWTARILGIFPTPSLSHQLPYQAVMKGLAARGHQVTVLSTDPLKEPVANYTDIDLSFTYKLFRDGITFAEMSETHPLSMVISMTPLFLNIVETQITSQEIQDFLRYNASQGYDMVFIEWWVFDAYYGVYHAVGSPPLVGIISWGGTVLQYANIGNPTNPAINPESFTSFSDHMTFWERVQNTYTYLRVFKHMEWTIYPANDALMQKLFGPGLPPVKETRYNISLLMLCNHWSMEYPRALMPNEVQLTGLHVNARPPALPAELKAWMDGAGPAGVVYFSLGTNVLSKDLPPTTREAILKAFARLPQRVLWKWEEEDMPNRPENVRVSKWLPQQSILAYPNVRLFITQGGLQSFQEASYHAVPLLGIPFMGDQHYNVGKMVSAKIGKLLKFVNITEDSMYSSITEIIEDPGYKERMRRFSSVFREHQTHSLENALWWVEYVLRHNGAPHLRSAALDLAWYELLLLDIVGAVLVTAVTVLLASFFITRALLRLVFRSTSTASLHQKKQQ